MLNVQTLTNTLSRMPLPQLQQYAALHKNDPYVVALALSIANQKKQMSTAQMGEAGAQPQPKVVDQEIAGMAQQMPENVGIGALPAPNMQRMAAGGIVAFDEGGEVPGYAGGLYAGAGDIPDWVKQLPPESGIRMYYEKQARGEPLLTEPLLDTLATAFKGTPQPAGTPNLPVTPGITALPGAPLVTPGGAGKRTAPPATAPAAAPRPTPAASAAAAAPAGLPALNTTAPTATQAKADAAALTDDSELRAKLEANEQFTTQAYDKLLGDYDKKVAELPEAYKGYEERLKKEEAEAATDKDKALGMAIFKAGLGMMAGTSQYAFENIGKGSLAGLEDYQSALKDFKKAQRERDKAFGDIEAARLAEKRGDIKAHTELQAKGIEGLGAAKNRTADGIAKIFQVNTETAKGIFETGLKDKAQNERTIYSGVVDLQKQQMASNAAIQAANIHAGASLKAAQLNAETYKLPMLYKAIEDSVDKQLATNINYKTADEATRTAMRDAALKKRLLATPGMAQFVPQEATGGGGGGLRYNPQTGKIE